MICPGPGPQRRTSWNVYVCSDLNSERVWFVFRTYMMVHLWCYLIYRFWNSAASTLPLWCNFRPEVGIIWVLHLRSCTTRSTNDRYIKSDHRYWPYCIDFFMIDFIWAFCSLCCRNWFSMEFKFQWNSFMALTQVWAQHFHCRLFLF